MGFHLVKWMKKIVFPFLIFLASLNLCLEAQSENLSSYLMTLKPRQPNWRFDVVKKHPSGNPAVILFYEPTLTGESAVKQVIFHENGKIQTEMDLTRVEEDSSVVKEWNSPFVPHGTWVDFSVDGELLKTAVYQFGVLNGPCKTFYSNGQIQSEIVYENGCFAGIAKSYFEDGKLKEEAFYEKGLLQGDVVQYHPNGNKAALFPHQDGKLHGTSLHWFPSGILNVQRQFKEGELQGDGKNPALLVYDEERNLIEALDFRKNEPTGLHIRYDKKGNESYRCYYKNGKKEGKEQFFEEGSLSGEGLFQKGVAVGRHWRNHPNGTLAYQANYSSKGELLEPICEFNEKGQKIKQFYVLNDQLQGPYFEWYEDDIPKVEYNYEKGQYEGEQKEFYPSGQLKVVTHYKNQVRDGLHEEWHENGVLARRIHFLEGLKDGQIGEWHANGNSKTDAYFQADRPEGVQSEWYENGQLKARSEFVAGLKQGWQREWNDLGDLLFEGLFVDDLMDGTVLSWWNKDQIKTRFQFEKGKKEGLHKWFYKDGKPERVAAFKKDLLEGEMLAWYPDGAIQSVQLFKEGHPVGEHRTYYPKSTSSEKDGDRLSHILFYNDQGQLDGEERLYYQKGALQAIVAYQNGLVHGKKQMFDPQGNLIEEAHYVQGKLEGPFIQRLADGKEVVTHYRQNLKHGPHLIFYPNQANGEKVKAFEATFENDQIEGLIFEYSADGKKIAETPYVHGKKEGTAKIFAAETHISITIEFSADQKNGLLTHYFPDGSVYKTIQYVNDVKEGPETTYHKNGAIASVFPYQNDQLNGLACSWNEEGILVFEGEYLNDLRHGKFNKYYDNGQPYLTQSFMDDKLEGEKRKYGEDGAFTVSFYEDGQLVKTVR
jgi:antitoxin component YwqK of YwqJK toxin-antitoxin module